MENTEMNIKINNTDSLENDFYMTIEKYVEFCVKNPAKVIKEKEKKGELRELGGSDNIKEILNEIENNKTASQELFKNMCEAISDGGIDYLDKFVKAAVKLSEDRKDLKTDLKKMFSSPLLQKIFREARNRISELFPSLIALNKTFNLDDQPIYSLYPKAAVYGSIQKQGDGTTKKAPLSNDDIHKMIELFIEYNDIDRLGEWVTEIIMYASEKLISDFRYDYETSRQELRDEIYKKVQSDDKYKIAAMTALLKNNRLDKLAKDSNELPKVVQKNIELEKKVSEIEESYKSRASANEEKAKIHLAEIETLRNQLDYNRTSMNEFDKILNERDRLNASYHLQISMNERITAENIRRIDELTDELNSIQSHLDECLRNASEREDIIDDLRNKLESLQSDLSLKNNEIIKLRENINKNDDTSRVDVLRDLITGINEQMFYLTMFYLELKDTGKLEAESIELYNDTLNNIDDVLLNLGVKKIGIIDQIVEYDSSVHMASNGKIANGEKAKICGYGWKIGDDVYIKALVEKGE